jgi:class 3 adenylate cyclase
VLDVADGPGAVLFTDIVDFTRYNAERGDDAAVDLLEEQSRIVRESLPDCARVVKELGDGLMLWVPDAHAAIDACLAIQARVTERQRGDDPVFVRIGGHWGTPRRRGDDLVGMVANLSARIVDLAGAGEVLVSEALLDSAGDLSSLPAHAHELGPVYVKGVPDPVALYRFEAVATTDPVTAASGW